MSRKKQTASSDLTTIRIGSRVKHVDEGVEGRITWANGTTVKIEWADGEKVTWKRAELAGKGLELVGDDDEPAAAGPVEQAQPTPLEEASNEPTTSIEEVATPPAAAHEPAPAKKAKAGKAKDGNEKKLSALDAAARVLAEAGQPMSCQEMIDTM